MSEKAKWTMEEYIYQEYGEPSLEFARHMRDYFRKHLLSGNYGDRMLIGGFASDYARIVEYLESKQQEQT